MWEMEEEKRCKQRWWGMECKVWKLFTSEVANFCLYSQLIVNDTGCIEINKYQDVQYDKKEIKGVKKKSDGITGNNCLRDNSVINIPVILTGYLLAQVCASEWLASCLLRVIPVPFQLLSCGKGWLWRALTGFGKFLPKNSVVTAINSHAQAGNSISRFTWIYKDISESRKIINSMRSGVSLQP